MTVILLFHVSYSDYICHIRSICRNAKEEKKEFDNNNQCIELTVDDFNTLKKFIEDSSKRISVVKGVNRKHTLRFVYLNFIVEAFRSHPLVQNIEIKNLNSSAFLPYQSILNYFGIAMFNFMFCGEERYGCIDSDEKINVTSAEGNFSY